MDTTPITPLLETLIHLCDDLAWNRPADATCCSG